MRENATSYTPKEVTRIYYKCSVITVIVGPHIMSSDYGGSKTLYLKATPE